MNTSGVLRVGLYSGIVVRHDAVSESLRLKHRILRRLMERGAPLDCRVFTYAAEGELPGLVATPGVGRLLGLDAFWATDLHVFEFGMYFDLIDALFVLPPDRPSLVIDHNTTPPELVELPEVKIGCRRALVQRHNLRRATRVACVSEFTVDLVRSVGVDDDRISVLHLPPAHPGALRGRTFAPDEPVRILFVGRLVHAKGVLDLVEATADLRGRGRCVVALAGSARFSDPGVVAEVRVAVSGSGGSLEWLDDVEPAELVRLYAASDVLVLPSYHEGYCVPVVEALSAGCRVITYDGSNLPNVGGGLGQLVPSGSVRELRGAISSLLIERAEQSARLGRPMTVPTSSGDLPEEQWLRRVHAHLADYSDAAYERRFLGLLVDLARGTPGGASAALETVVDERISELAVA